jgi:hypothetical protein
MDILSGSTSLDVILVMMFRKRAARRVVGPHEICKIPYKLLFVYVSDPAVLMELIWWHARLASPLMMFLTPS